MAGFSDQPRRPYHQAPLTVVGIGWSAVDSLSLAKHVLGAALSAERLPPVVPTEGPLGTPNCPARCVPDMAYREDRRIWTKRFGSVVAVPDFNPAQSRKVK
jgi:hypothetical protein